MLHLLNNQSLNTPHIVTYKSKLTVSININNNAFSDHLLRYN